MSDFDLFHNELADDLTREYGELLELGLHHDNIVQVLLERYDSRLENGLQQVVFWLSLAKIQVLLELAEDKPALHPAVRDNTIAIIRELIVRNEPIYQEHKEDLDDILEDLVKRL